MKSSDVSVAKISFCNIIEILAVHDIHVSVIMLPQQLKIHTDVKVTSKRHPVAYGLNTTGGNSVVAMVTDLWHLLTENSRVAWHTIYAMVL